MESDLDALSNILESIEDPEFKARVADLLWVRKRDRHANKVAVRAYFGSAKRLKIDDSWPPYAERLERGARLAAIEGFCEECELAVSVPKDAIGDFKDSQDSGLLCTFLEFVLEYELWR